MKPVNEIAGSQLRIIGGPYPNSEASSAYYEQCKVKTRELGLGQVVHFTEGIC